MAAWQSMDDGWYDRDETYGQHVRVEAFYPDWQQDEATAAELCATIDRAAATFYMLADELATLTAIVTPEGSSAGSSPALGHHFKDAA